MKNRNAFGVIMARVADKRIGKDRALVDLAAIMIRGAFGEGDGADFTGYDYTEQEWRRASFANGIATTYQGAGK